MQDIEKAILKTRSAVDPAQKIFLPCKISVQYLQQKS